MATHQFLLREAQTLHSTHNRQCWFSCQGEQVYISRRPSYLCILLLFFKMPKRKKSHEQRRQLLKKAREKKKRIETTTPSSEEEIIVAGSSTTASPRDSTRTSPRKSSAEKRKKHTTIMNKYLKTQDARMNVKPKIKMRNKKLQQDLDYAAGVF